MEGFDIVIQLGGLLAGAAGAYYGYRQYRLAHRPRATTAVVSGKDGAVTASHPEIFYTEGRLNTGDRIGVGIPFALAIFMFVMSRMVNDDGNHRAEPDEVGLLAVAVGLMFLGIFLIGHAGQHRSVEIDDTGIVVMGTLRDHKPSARFVWSRARCLKIRNTKDGRFLFFFPQTGQGFEPGIPDHRWDDSKRSYFVCAMSTVKPSEEAFLTALENHSGGRFRRFPTHRRHR